LRSNSTQPSELQRDPVFQLIVASLIQYKTLQQVKNAALFDFSVAQFGICPVSMHDQQVIAPNALAILCAGMLPHGRDILVELGLEEGSVDLIPPTEINVENAISTRDNASVMSISTTNKLPSSHTDVSEDLDELLSTASIQTGTASKKISDLPAVERRKSTIITVDQQRAQKQNQQSESTKESKPKQPPNYFKPTANYLAKNTIKYPESDPEPIQAPNTSLRKHATSSKATTNSAPVPVLANQPPPNIPTPPEWESVLDFQSPNRTIHQLPLPSDPIFPIAAPEMINHAQKRDIESRSPESQQRNSPLNTFTDENSLSAQSLSSVAPSSVRLTISHWLSFF
jgi:hypothetical protein